jgi:myo-inositol-1(or 4)-monophosphatase
MNQRLMDANTIKQIGTRAAYKAGKILNEHFGHALKITKKGAIDLVTQADIASEQIIIATIKEAFPDHAILAEESGLANGVPDKLWVIDPLDGTTNFAHGLPLFCISIAFVYHNDITMGLVLNPVNGEFYTAVRGQGAYLKDSPIQVSSTSKVSDGLLVTGFPYDIQTTSDHIIPRFARCLKAAQGVRRLGSAALDLCFVACGRFDGFWEENLRLWDVAAGKLIVEEAKGRVSDYADQDYLSQLDILKPYQSNQLLATNGTIHAEMVSLMNAKDLS